MAIADARTAAGQAQRCGDRIATVLTRILLILSGVMIAALLSELALRTADTIPEVANPLYSFHDSDPVLGWRGKPGARMRFRRPDFQALIEHGPTGWRRPDPPPPAAPRRRVLVLGDSFTWGWGVSQGEVFTDRLQARLAPDVVILNRGVNGFGTGQEYLVLQDELAAGPVDVVLLMFVNNDVADNVDPKSGRRPLFTLRDGVLVPPAAPTRPLLTPIQRFLKDHSRAYQLLDLELNRLSRGRERDEAPPPPAARADIDYRTVPGAAVTVRLLDEMQRLSSAHGARLVIVYIPERSQIEPGATPPPPIRAIRALLGDVTAVHGIPFLDLTEPLRARAAAGEAVIFPTDQHWTPAGHALAADVLLASGVLDAPAAPP